MSYLCIKLAQWNEYQISTGNTDGLVLKHQGNSNHKDEYVPMHTIHVLMQLTWVIMDSFIFR